VVAPICIELVADPPPEPDLVHTLVDSCSGAAGGAGCVLDPNSRAPADARVRVTFEAGYARARVEAASTDRTPHAKDVVFREQDPAVERFRATGLVVAGLVSGLRGQRHAAASALETRAEEPPTADEAPVADGRPDGSNALPPSAPAVVPSAERSPTPERRDRGPVWSAAALLNVTTTEPSIGLRFAVDVPIGNTLGFLTLSVSHEQTLRSDANGVAEQQQGLGLGGGLALPLMARLTLRLPLEFEIEHLRAFVVQPNTGRQDAGSRVMVALDLGADVVGSFGDRFGVFVGAFGTWRSEATDIRVAGRVVTTIAPLQLSAATGLNVRFP
jgi:hypothetical protein